MIEVKYSTMCLSDYTGQIVGIECRLTEGTGGSANGEILAAELGKKETDQVKNTKAIHKRRT
jgi:hypothetical protein